MEYRSSTYGTRRRVHREYVDVYARFGRDGAIEPVCIMWKDGRSFRVDEVIDAGGFGTMSRGRQTARRHGGVRHRRVRFRARAARRRNADFFRRMKSEKEKKLAGEH